MAKYLFYFESESHSTITRTYFFHEMEEYLSRNQDEVVLNYPVVFCLIACIALAVSQLVSAWTERLPLLEEGITRDQCEVLPQKSTLNNIMELMHCPVCLTFPESTPIFQCLWEEFLGRIDSQDFALDLCWVVFKKPVQNRLFFDNRMDEKGHNNLMEEILGMCQPMHQVL